MDPEFLPNRDAATQKLKEVLESWPLYRELKYTCEDTVLSLPNLLRLYCDRCQQDEFWERSLSPSESEASRRIGLPLEGGTTTQLNHWGFRSSSYVCRSCEGGTTRFFYLWFRVQSNDDEQDDVWMFQKNGQFPPIQERIDPVLRKRLGDDLDLYTKAIRCRNFNYGMGALVYMRRVVENQMNSLLDLIAEDAEASGVSEGELKRLDEVKKGRHSDKVDYAKSLIPSHLKPGGRNPVDALYGAFSDGIHNKTDDECIEIVDRMRLAFEYLFKTLQVSSEDAKEFVRALNTVNTKGK